MVFNSWFVTLVNNTFAKATLFFALLGVTQLLFLCVCWKWGLHEVNAEKQKLRDSLAFITALLYIALIAIEIQIKTPITQTLIALSFDSQLLLGIAFTYILQIDSLNKSIYKVFFFIFLIFNFLPLIELFDTEISLLPFITQQFTKISNIVQVLILIALIFIVVKSRKKAVTILKQEVYMDSKYKITGGQQGSVGDNATNQNTSI